MALSIVGTGSQACTVTTEHTLDTETAAGIYQAEFNLTTCVNGDAFRIRVYKKTITGDTAEVVYDTMYANDQGANCQIVTPPWISNFSTSISITQTTGTSRTIPWNLILVAT